MYRSALRTTARAIHLLSSRRLASSTRVQANNSQASNRRDYKSILAATGSLALVAYTLLLPATPISSDTEGKTLAESSEEKPVVVVKSDSLTEPAESLPPTEADEEDKGRQAAYNPETGEINWDCPCLGGMAHGPCGEEFKEAFSCFIYSELEPKGIDCIEKFKNMQNCFRQYPEVYSEELRDEDEDEQTVVEVVEDDHGNVVTDVITVDTKAGQVVSIDEEVFVDRNDDVKKAVDLKSNDLEAVVTDVVTVNTEPNDVVVVDEQVFVDLVDDKKKSSDLKDVDEFIKEEPGNN